MHPDKKTEELEQKIEFEQEEIERCKQFETIKDEIIKNEIVLGESVVKSEQEIIKEKKREWLFEMALFLILGILLGITVKTEAIKKITIGFNDYQINSVKSSYDIAAIKKNLEAENAAIQAQAQAQSAQVNPIQDKTQK